MACGLMATLVVFAPAKWLAAAVHRASHEQISMVNPRGTLWHGTAQLVLSGGRGSNDTVGLPGQIEWQVNPRWGPLHITLLADCCMHKPLEISVKLQGTFFGTSGVQVSLDDQQTNWPTSLLTGLGTPWNTLQLQGQLNLRHQNLVLAFARTGVALEGLLQVEAMQVSSRLSTLKPMGSYRLILLGGPTPTLQLETLEGSLELSGKGQWAGQRLRFDGVATAQPDRIEAVSNLLNIIGRRNGARSLIHVGS